MIDHLWVFHCLISHVKQTRSMKLIEWIPLKCDTWWFIIRGDIIRYRAVHFKLILIPKFSGGPVIRKYRWIFLFFCWSAETKLFLLWIKFFFEIFNYNFSISDRRILLQHARCTQHAFDIVHWVYLFIATLRNIFFFQLNNL